jgi:KTSC domain
LRPQGAATRGGALALCVAGLVQLRSSVVKYARYDSVARELTVSLHETGIYTYVGVPKEIYMGLLAAPSKGAFYNAHIRDRFSYKR